MLMQAHSTLKSRDVGRIAFRRDGGVYPAAKPGTCLFGTGVARV